MNMSENVVLWISFAAGAMTLIAAVFAFFTVKSWRKKYIDIKNLELIEDIISLFTTIDEQLDEHLSKYYHEFNPIERTSNWDILTNNAISEAQRTFKVLNIVKEQSDRINIASAKLSIYHPSFDPQPFQLLQNILETIRISCISMQHSMLMHKADSELHTSHATGVPSYLIDNANETIATFKQNILGYTRFDENELKRDMNFSIDLLRVAAHEICYNSYLSKLRGDIRKICKKCKHWKARACKILYVSIKNIIRQSYAGLKQWKAWADNECDTL